MFKVSSYLADEALWVSVASVCIVWKSCLYLRLGLGNLGGGPGGACGKNLDSSVVNSGVLWLLCVAALHAHAVNLV